MNYARSRPSITKSFAGPIPMDFSLLATQRSLNNSERRLPNIRLLSNPVKDMTEERLGKFALFESVDSRTRVINDHVDNIS